MSENDKALTTTREADLGEYGGREELVALTERFRKMIPGELSTGEAAILAQYARLMDANPFRGEIYAYPDRGEIKLVEGYKLLIRWARRQCNYSEKYTPFTEDLPEGAIGYRCHILRDDAKQTLADFVAAGASFQEAYEIAAASAVGVVTKDDTWSRKKNKPIDPPKGWTWDEVARKRALKNALNRAYGSPSPKEIAKETWMVGDTETRPEDWQKALSFADDDSYAGVPVEQLAEFAAEERVRQQATGEMAPRKAREIIEAGRVILHGDDAADWDAPQTQATEEPAEDGGDLYSKEDFHTVAIPAILDLVEGNSHRAAGIVQLYKTQQHPLRVEDFVDWAGYYVSARREVEKDEAVAQATHEFIEAVPFE